MSSAIGMERIGDANCFYPRSYQIEMLQRSLARNLIITMDTGSGKTAIAVLRIRVELERTAKEKRIWFLAPTVVLCRQQDGYIQRHLPDVTPKLLLGADNVDRWSDQETWDAALYNHRVVLSTPAVLLDALRHGFVKMTNLALIVFDEAHHCVRRNPASLIMREFYHPMKDADMSHQVPHILGLTASPIVRSNLREITVIEHNLDAICAAPLVYRPDMLKQVHRPDFVVVPFSITSMTLEEEVTLRKLFGLCPSNRGVSGVKSRIRHSTLGTTTEGQYRAEAQINQLYTRTRRVYDELGSWAADHFICRSISLWREESNSDSHSYFHRDNLIERLAPELFNQADLRQCTAKIPVAQPDVFSPKVQRLVGFLARLDSESTCGIIFVRERIIVSMLFLIMSNHPQLDHLRFATFVGSSSSSQRRAHIHELLNVHLQESTLRQFRAKERHVIIATDVLEEGIDVAACNLVVCFDLPANLKSFIQRRGRARLRKSQFVMLHDKNADNLKADLWMRLEQELVRLCQDEERLQHSHSVATDEDEHKNLVLFSRHTSARLDVHSVMGHLYHFCDRLPKVPFVDCRPSFTILQDHQTDSGVVAKVLLPNCMGAFRRWYVGTQPSQTQQAAYKVAAFSCYQTLHMAGLVNDDLLPQEEALLDHCQNLPPMIEVQDRIRPWVDFANGWPTTRLHVTRIMYGTVGGTTRRSSSLLMVTPTEIPNFGPTNLGFGTIAVSSVAGPGELRQEISQQDLDSYRRAMVSVPFSGTERKNHSLPPDFVHLFVLETSSSGMKELRVMHGDEKRENEGPGSSHPAHRQCIATESLEVTARSSHGHFCMSGGLDAEDSFDTESQLAIPWSDWQHIPQLLRYIEKLLIARALQKLIGAHMSFKDPIHVVTAITTPSADNNLNYQRYGFLGDAVLKLLVSLQFFVIRADWPPGWLTQAQHTLVSNANLANAILASGMDIFIITDPIREKVWTLPRVSDTKLPASNRTMNSRALSDAAQALCGAAYLDSGFQASRRLMHFIIAEIDIEDPLRGYEHQSCSTATDLQEVNTLLGYQFRNNMLLLQALTHPSCATGTSAESYQRLAFLGDAVMNLTIATCLFKHSPDLSEGDMTKIRSAITHGHFLGYVCLEHSIARHSFDITEDSSSLGCFIKRSCSKKMQLWNHLRHESQEVASAQVETEKYYMRLRTDIEDEMECGNSFPWVTLAELRPEAFYSDLMQSTVAAIYIDSSGDLDMCQRFLETVGIGQVIRRMMRGHVETEHPRSRLSHLNESVEVRSECQVDGSFAGLARLHELEIARIEGCRTGQQAEIAAARGAVRYLEKAKKRCHS